MSGTASATSAPRRRLGADERREQLMAAVVDVVAEQGYRAATADAIAARAGVSKGLLWHYFDDLDDLMARSARRTLMVVARAVGDGLDLDAPVPVLLRAAIRAAAHVPDTYGREHRALQQIVPNLRGPDGAPRLTLDDYGELRASQAALFRRGQAEGDVDPDLDPEVLALTYQAAVDAMIAHLQLHPEADADQHAEQLATLILRGCRPER